jgi:hypothetical protein
MIDNLDIILPLLDFKSGDDFYYLQILQRKKENPQLGSNSRVIKNYYIKSRSELINKYEEIKTLCNVFNARASIRLNRRSFEKVAYKSMVNTANTMSNREFKFIAKSYDRACGLGHNDPDKTWILDVDEELTPELLNIIEGFTEGVEPNKGYSKVLVVIPSKSGYHVITRPFNIKDWGVQFPDVEIHKDNPTNLFIP